MAIKTTSKEKFVTVIVEQASKQGAALSYHRARVPQEGADGWHRLTRSSLADQVAAGGSDARKVLQDDLKQ